MHGHDVGDAVLQHLGRHLATTLRAEDVVAPSVAEEFVVAMLGVSLDVAARRLAHVLAQFRVAGVELADGQWVHVGVSGGIARYPEHGTSFRELHRTADVALRQAKEAGRGRVRQAGNDEIDRS